MWLPARSLDTAVYAVLVIYGAACPIYWLVDAAAAAAAMKASLLFGATAAAAGLIIGSVRAARRRRHEIAHAAPVVRGVATAVGGGVVVSPITQVPCVWAAMTIEREQGESYELLHSESHDVDFALITDAGARVSVPSASVRCGDLDNRRTFYGCDTRVPRLRALLEQRGLAHVDPRAVRFTEESIGVGAALSLRSAIPGSAGHRWLTDKSDGQLQAEVRRRFRADTFGAFVMYVVPAAAFSLAPSDAAYRISVAFMFLFSVTGLGVLLDSCLRRRTVQS